MTTCLPITPCYQYHFALLYHALPAQPFNSKIPASSKLGLFSKFRQLQRWASSKIPFPKSAGKFQPGVRSDFLWYRFSPDILAWMIWIQKMSIRSGSGGLEDFIDNPKQVFKCPRVKKYSRLKIYRQIYILKLSSRYFHLASKNITIKCLAGVKQSNEHQNMTFCDPDFFQMFGLDPHLGDLVSKE